MRLHLCLACSVKCKLLAFHHRIGKIWQTLSRAEVWPATRSRVQQRPCGTPTVVRAAVALGAVGAVKEAVVEAVAEAAVVVVEVVVEAVAEAVAEARYQNAHVAVVLSEAQPHSLDF